MRADLAATLQPAQDRTRVTAVARALLGGGLDYCIRATGTIRFRDLEPRDAICVSGIARGGTTWLAEMLASDPRHLLIFEPLQPYSGREPLDRKSTRLNSSH